MKTFERLDTTIYHRTQEKPLRSFVRSTEGILLSMD